AFFGLTLDGPGAARRRLGQSGVVELSSASGQCWMRAALFVSDHPYLTRTAADGSFTLSQVPPGTYDLVCWLPGPRGAVVARRPHTSHAEPTPPRPPLEKVQKVRVAARGTSQAKFVIAAKELERCPLSSFPRSAWERTSATLRVASGPLEGRAVRS